MKKYALMVQTDADDRFFADSTMDELKTGVDVFYIGNIDEIGKTINTKGVPSLILINDSSIRPASSQLKYLKNTEELSHIPVVILGEIATEEYIRKYYANGANSYIVKPSSIEETRKKIELFFKYWFEVAEV